MVLLLNILLPLILLSIIFVGYKFYLKSKNKLNTIVKTLVCILSVTVMYGLIQPSYLPKGTVKSLPKVVIEDKQLEMNNVLSKPEERDVSKTLTVREEVKNILNK